MHAAVAIPLRGEALDSDGHSNFHDFTLLIRTRSECSLNLSFHFAQRSYSHCCINLSKLSVNWPLLQANWNKLWTNNANNRKVDRIFSNIELLEYGNWIDKNQLSFFWFLPSLVRWSDSILDSKNSLLVSNTQQRCHHSTAFSTFFSRH